MGRACCVSGCDSGVKVPSHKFPKNPKRCAEWVNNLNLEYLKNYDSNSLQKFKVCHKHFRETDYCFAPYNRLLKDTAIPFIEDTTVVDTITNNSQQQQSQQFNLLLEVKNPKRCAEWVNNLNLEHLKNYDSNSLQKFKVCHKHFRETDYCFALHNHLLKDTAIPFIEDTTVVDTITNNSQQQQSQQFNLLLENIEQIKIEPQEKLVQYQIYNEQQYKETTENKQQENIQIPQIKEENPFHQVMHVNNQEDINNQEHVNNQENKEDPESFKLIQDHEYRLNKLEEKVDFMLNSSKRRIWNRPDLPKITRKAKLTAKVKSLYGTIIKLRRDNRQLQRLLQRFREENARKGQKTTLSLSKSNKAKTNFNKNPRKVYQYDF